MVLILEKGQYLGVNVLDLTMWFIRRSIVKDKGIIESGVLYFVSEEIRGMEDCVYNT